MPSGPSLRRPSWRRHSRASARRIDPFASVYLPESAERWRQKSALSPRFPLGVRSSSARLSWSETRLQFGGQDRPARHSGGRRRRTSTQTRRLKIGYEHRGAFGSCSCIRRLELASRLAFLPGMPDTTRYRAFQYVVDLARYHMLPDLIPCATIKWVKCSKSNLCEAQPLLIMKPWG